MTPIPDLFAVDAALEFMCLTVLVSFEHFPCHELFTVRPVPRSVTLLSFL